MGLRKVAVVTPGSFVIPSGRSSSVERVVEQTIPLAQGAMDVRIFGVLGKDSLQKTRSTAFRVTACHRERIIILPCCGGSRNGDRILSKYTIARCWLSV